MWVFKIIHVDGHMNHYKMGRRKKFLQISLEANNIPQQKHMLPKQWWLNSPKKLLTTQSGIPIHNKKKKKKKKKPHIATTKPKSNTHPNPLWASLAVVHTMAGGSSNSVMDWLNLTATITLSVSYFLVLCWFSSISPILEILETKEMGVD